VPSILAIDQSTSATKAVLFNVRGQVLGRASREHRQHYPKPGWVEQDAEEIWQNTLAVIKEVADQNRDSVSEITCLSLTNQRETIVMFERATGRPLFNAIVWQCRRGDGICEQLRQKSCESLVRAKTGLKLDTYFSASKLKWLIGEKPELAAKLKKGDSLIGTIDAYLIYRLTGGAVFATDSTNASRTLLYDIGKLRWDEELCELFDVPVKSLPEVRESAARFGETDAAGILPRRLPICGVMGDSQASLFSQHCYEPGMAKTTFGTGTSVLLNVGNSPRISEKGAVCALAWVWRGKPTYALEGLINFSSATINWLKEQLGLIQDSVEVEALATSVEDNGGVYLVPAFAGLSAPWWSPTARAAIVGMTTHTRKEHLVRAAEEAIAYQIRDVLEMMRAESGVVVERIAADGGPTRDKFLMQFTADIADVELRVSDIPESSARGAAMVGMLGMGLAKSFEDLAALPHEVRIIRPQMQKDRAKQLCDGWLSAVKRAL
jgi:glycerol kinase